MEDNVDVAVIGGGPAGTATALALRRLGCSAVVIEKSDYGGIRVGETLPPRVRPLLDALGMWQEFSSGPHLSSFGIRSSWGRNDVYENDFIFNPYGAGWHVDRARFDAMLARGAEKAGATVRLHTSLVSFNRDGSGRWRIEVERGNVRQRLTADFIVDATGRASSFARRHGLKRIAYDHLIGFVRFGARRSSSVRFGARRSSGEVADSFTLIEAVDDGWWYAAILPGMRAVVVYMTDADVFRGGQKAAGDYWLRQLHRTNHIRSSIAGFALESRSHVVPANTSRLEDVAGDGWLAVGDAAMAFDPLSGQGVYKALQWALRAAEAIQQSKSGSKSALRDYDHEAKAGAERYLSIRASFYAGEQRWTGSPFWQRRQSAPPVGQVRSTTASRSNP